MKTVLTKSAKLFVALMIPVLFMTSCNDDSVEPTAARPKASDIVTPPR